MLADWQNIAVLLIVLAALVYVGRRGWARLRALLRRAGDESACATGCGSCGPREQPTEPRANVLVQIGRAGAKANRTGR